MKSVVYEGPYSAVEVPAVGATVAKGEAVEVDADIASALIRQGWREAKTQKEQAK